MRHKLYQAIETLVNADKLNGEIKMDFSYFKINLKGVSHHKVCVLTTVDSNDNCITKITGLGLESVEKLSIYKDSFSPGSIIVSDSKSSNTKFTRTINCKTNLVPSDKHLTKDGNHINDINQLHQELKIMNVKYRDISTRHLQDYLNFKCFLKKLTYTTELKRRKIQAYLDILEAKKKLSNSNICTMDMPIDLYEVYGEYHYGIYALKS